MLVAFRYPSVQLVDTNLFNSMVGGVIWLVRNSKNIVKESCNNECADIQETGSLIRFCKAQSARSALGALANGSLILIQISGKTDQSGIDLERMAEVMLDLGAVQAINLDGGGSSTLVINNTVVSHPSDYCTKSPHNWEACPRNISSIVCVVNETRSGSISSSYKAVLMLVVIGLVVFVVFGICTARLISKRQRSRTYGKLFTINSVLSTSHPGEIDNFEVPQSAV